jgi:hypothetical protein
MSDRRKSWTIDETSCNKYEDLYKQMFLNVCLQE